MDEISYEELTEDEEALLFYLEANYIQPSIIIELITQLCKKNVKLEALRDLVVQLDTSEQLKKILNGSAYLVTDNKRKNKINNLKKQLRDANERNGRLHKLLYDNGIEAP